MTADLFLIASRNKYRFPSEKGYLTVEQLWDLPLSSRSKFDLNNVAIAVNNELKSIAEESFVEASSNPRKGELERQLELVKFIISTKQEENQKATDRAAKAALKAKIQEAIEVKQDDAMRSSSLEDLKAQLAALES
jgi:hypothetical protein